MGLPVGETSKSRRLGFVFMWVPSWWSTARSKSAWRSLPASAARAASRRPGGAGSEARRGVKRSGRPAIASMMTQSGAAFLPGVVSGPLARPGGSAHDRTPLLSCSSARPGG